VVVNLVEQELLDPLVESHEIGAEKEMPSEKDSPEEKGAEADQQDGAGQVSPCPEFPRSCTIG